MPKWVGQIISEAAVITSTDGRVDWVVAKGQSALGKNGCLIGRSGGGGRGLGV